MSPAFTVAPLSPALGARVDGISLRDGLPDADFNALRQVLAERGVIVIDDQPLTPEQHLAFARRWGEINVNRFFQPVAGYPQIAEVRKEPRQQNNIGAGWHTDHSYDQVPALGSVLHAQAVPAHGGDTLFTSMYAAYDALPETMKRTLRGLRAHHSSRHVFGASRGADYAGRIGNAQAACQDACHPVVIRHPDSGRSALYVNPEFTVAIDGWPADESQDLLQRLFAHADNDAFRCRVQWRRNTITVWDNRATWHKALNDYPGEFRLLHRITLEGVPLQAAGA